MAKATHSFHEGQTVLFISPRMEPFEVEVVSVARTNVTAMVYGRERVFNAVTGIDPRNRIGEPDRIATSEMLEDEARRKDIQTELRKFGVDMLSTARDYTTDTLAKVLGILQDERISR